MTTPERRGKASVLVVDAEASLRRLAADALASGGYGVRETATAGEALALLADESVECALVLTDLWLGPMSGPDLAAIAQRMRPDLAVLYMTSDPTLFAAASRPAAGILAKPFTVESLLAAVAYALTEGEHRDKDASP